MINKSQTIDTYEKKNDDCSIKNFNEKEEAIAYIKKYSIENKKLYLFSQYLTKDEIKTFHVTDANTIYNTVISKNYNFHEFINDDENIKLYFDVILTNEKVPESCDYTNYFNSVVDNAINLILKKLKNFNISDPQIIILSSTCENKTFFRVIFCNVIFKNIYFMKFFVLNLKINTIRDLIIDPRIYRVSCVRMLYCSTREKHNKLIFNRAVNYDYGNDDKKLFTDSLLTNIPEKYDLIQLDIPENIPFFENKCEEQKIKDVLNNETEKFMSINYVKQFVDLLDLKRVNDYKEWYKIGRAIYNSNSSAEGFDLWHNWSKLSKKYDPIDGERTCLYIWNNFKVSYYASGRLLCLARKDSPDKFLNIQQPDEKSLFNPILFESDYLLQKNEKLKEFSSIVSEKIYEWYFSPHQKTIGIQSACDTGKSTLIGHIFEEFCPKRVLIISYSQYHTQQLYGKFKKYGFKYFMEEFVKSNKIICQIEDLYKLLDYTSSSEYISIPSYDLVVINESENILVHFKSAQLCSETNTFVLLTNICHNSNKIIGLDSDFGNRSFQFLSEFDKPIVLCNTVKKKLQHFVFTNNKKYFDEKIESNLMDKKTVAIVTISAELGKIYYAYYLKKKYKVCFYSSDDLIHKTPTELITLRKNYQLLIYSPTRESGCSVNIENYDYMYTVLCASYISPRNLLQLTEKARDLKNKTICVYLNSLPYKETIHLYTNDEVAYTVTKGFNNFLDYTKHVNEVTKQITYKMQCPSLYTKILIHNEVQFLNKTRSYFISQFIKSLVKKGHTYEYIKDENIESCDFILRTTERILKRVHHKV